MARLIDTSLWVDFTRSQSPPALKALIHPWILDPGACLCEPVVFEILRLATPAERPLIEAQFETLPLIATPPTLWRDATRLGQRCRDRGRTPGSLDLLIAATATAAQMSIHADNAATASTGAAGVRGAQRAMSRKIRAMREMDADAADLSASMERILREEERRED